MSCILRVDLAFSGFFSESELDWESVDKTDPARSISDAAFDFNDFNVYEDLDLLDKGLSVSFLLQAEDGFQIGAAYQGDWEEKQASPFSHLYQWRHPQELSGEQTAAKGFPIYSQEGHATCFILLHQELTDEARLELERCFRMATMSVEISGVEGVAYDEFPRVSIQKCEAVPHDDRTR